MDEIIHIEKKSLEGSPLKIFRGDCQLIIGKNDEEGLWLEIYDGYRE